MDKQKKIYTPLTKQDAKWIKKIFNEKEVDAQMSIWGSVVLYDEVYVRNSSLFKEYMKNN